MQQCQWCKILKDETEFHWKSVDVERLKVCKVCRKGQSKLYRDRSKEKRYEYNKKYSEEHREYIAEYMKEYYRENIDIIKIRLGGKAEELSDRATLYYYQHKDERREYNARWNKNNPGKSTLYWRKRKAIQNGASLVDFTDLQWKELLGKYDYSCAYCGASNIKLQQDHVHPVSRGGNHTASNIVPACISCNSSKKDRTLEQWKRTLYFREHCTESRI